MSLLSRLAESQGGSEIVKLGNEINKRIAQGEKIYNYTIGDFNPQLFPIPALLEDMIVDAYRQHETNYPPAAGIADLRQAVSEFAAEHHDIHYAPAGIQIASGGRPLIYTAFRTLVDEGDKVIYAVPSWNNNHYTNINLGVHCLIPATAENNFMPTLADIKPHIAGATLLCLCSPQNPSGTTMSKATLEGICDLVLEENKNRTGDTKKLYLLYDQIYALLTYSNIKHYNPVALRPQMKDYTIFIDGISKSFAATGVRVGWALGPERVLTAMRALLSHIGAWAPMPEQKGVARFLRKPDVIAQYLVHFKAGLNERLIMLYDGFMELKKKGYPVDCIAPQAAIYLTVKIDIAGKHALGQLIVSQKAAHAYILAKAQLALVPFSAFGGQDDSPWYRMSVGTCIIEEVPAMLSLLEQALAAVH
jgi:aspartate aminotransferase